MQLFTVIGLMLSVCGAGYASLTAFRNYFHESIRFALKEAPQKVELITAKDRSDTARKKATCDHAIMKISSRVWDIAHWVVISAFLGFAFGVSIYAVCFWDSLTNSAGLAWARTLIFWILGVNIVALIAAGVALLFFKAKAKDLDSLWAQFQERRAGESGISPSSPPGVF